MSTNDAQSRISDEATRATERFMNILDSNLGPRGFAIPSGSASRATLVDDISGWVKSAIEAEVRDGKHAEGYTEEDSLKNVEICPDEFGISESGGVVLKNVKVQGDGWTVIAEKEAIDLPK
ncbi:hypothetical protein B9479_003727 [Cryptococcus floricola]|uniref:Uncharacterized protein n=1 Tax=Cryptococcus floricola TaxID=2591691 RepID=A0A5D3AVY9_9TREE|nr:hypothetical protein B9479_003727 [Cryptococcus floricola]